MTVSILEQTPAAPWYKHRWPWFLMLGPATAVVVGSYFGYLAYTQQDALVVGDYYKKGKTINQDLRRDHRAADLGLSAQLSYDAARGVLVGQLTRATATAQQEKLFVHLSHATLPEKDINLVVQPDANGAFELNLPMLEQSRWVVLVEGEQRDWRLAGSWSWPKQRAVSLQADLAKPVDD
ncbi:FixH family protein [Duganella qianjiadongensis]|uniref:Cytochrome oxidase assembly protein n=1 Tax=Duganella qianjiadongensis TaxID=2692176 RepID=A0ABW9VS52_9BURK|nr:FixH family protein [Duganella qianjiadongensis]MYM41454.1 cytochrome oxidase assembly protein [Duganella qianjiadongensis]